LTDADSYRLAMAGCDVVLNVAGLTYGRTLAEFRHVNVGGAEALARAAAQECPDSMLIHVSSQAAAGPSLDGRPRNEEDRPRPISWYGQSKLEGEQAIGYYHRGPWCVIRPSVVYGPGDPGMVELFRIVARGIAPIIAEGKQRLQLLAAGDLARIVLAAACRPDLHGRRGFVAGDTASSGDVVRCLAGMRSPPAVLVNVPRWAVRLAGAVVAVQQAVTGRTALFNEDKVREMLTADWLCEPGPFLRQLGISGLTPWKAGLEATCRWYVQERWVSPRFVVV
jgi:nucleoside-diphosphate-sugar epimerase